MIGGDTALQEELTNALDLGEGERTEEAQPQETEVEPTEEQNAAQETAEGGEEGGIQYFTELADMFEDITPEDLYGLKLRDGNGHEYTVGEYKDAMARITQLDAERQAFEEQRKRETEEFEQLKQQTAQQGQMLANAPQELKDAEAAVIAITQQAKAVNWEELEKENPGEAALLRQKYREAYDGAVRHYHGVRTQAQQAQETAYGDYIAQQRDLLLTKKPEWRDPNAFKASLERTVRYVEPFQITQQELMALSDYRLTLLLDDYARLKEQYEGAKVNEKEVRERGRRFRPRANVESKRARIQKQIDHAKSSNATRGDRFAAERAVVEQMQDLGVL